MGKPSLLKKALDIVADLSVNNTANVLIMASSLGWLASSLAQVAGIYFNKNYTKEEKSFMIPQELADAAVNIGMFLLVTKSLKGLATKMVETGKLTPKSISRFLDEKGLSAMRGNFDFNLTAVEGFSAHQETYHAFKTGAEATAAIIGGIISSNIITPVLRNKIASKRKDGMMKKLNTGGKVVEQKMGQPLNTGSIHTQRHTFEDFKNGARTVTTPSAPQENAAARATFEAFRTGGMRI